MAEDKQQEEAPLSSEALKRDEWRGDATVVREADASGHTIPESERGPEDEGGTTGSGAATMLPPD